MTWREEHVAELGFYLCFLSVLLLLLFAAWRWTSWL